MASTVAPSATSSPRVTIVGHVTHDYYGGRIVPGGCAFYGARVYQALGARVRLLTSWGSDFTCAPALASLAHVGHVEGGQTTTFVNTYRPDATRLQVLRAQAPGLEPSALAALEGAHADVLHLAPVLDEIALAAWMPRVRALKADGHVGRVALSVQGFARAKRAGAATVEIEHVPWRPDRALLDGVDVAFLSDEDLSAQDTLLECLRDAVGCVVLTHGAHGAEVFAGSEVRAQVGVYPTTAVDPTGAGDTFAAAFMVATEHGASIDDALRLAAAAGSIIVEGEGPAQLDAVAGAVARAGRVERWSGRQLDSGRP